MPTGIPVEFSEILGGGSPFPGSGRTSGWIKWEAVETASNCTAAVNACHHSSWRYVPVVRSFAKQTPGKSVPVCYPKPTCTQSNFNKREGLPRTAAGQGGNILDSWKRKLVSLIALFKSSTHPDVSGSMLFWAAIKQWTYLMRYLLSQHLDSNGRRDTTNK